MIPAIATKMNNTDKHITVSFSQQQAAIVLQALTEYQQDFEAFLNSLEIVNDQSINDLCDTITFCEESNAARGIIQSKLGMTK